MDHYFAILGLICTSILGALARDTVMVNSDITVKPTPSPLIDPNDRVDVVLNCTGSRSDLSYYIKNRVMWTFVDSKGAEKGITESFYQAPKSEYAAEQFQSGHITFKYEQTTSDKSSPYAFLVSINGVNRADNGIYRCSLFEGNTLIDQKELKLTVTNPVETLSMEIHDMEHKVLATSRKMPKEKDTPVKLTPGKYMVKCDAGGSNPEPRMGLFLGDRQVAVEMTAVANPATEFASYRGNFMVHDLTINAHNAIQTLVCQANIDGDYYPSLEAGLSLMVRIDKPTIVCENATASLGDRNTKVKCKATAGENSGALLCENFHWRLSVKGQSIAYDQRWKDPSKDYDILESACEKSVEGLMITLDLFSVNEKLFKETFFLVYGSGENIHQHPVTLYDVTVGAAGIMTPLSLLACLVLAFISKHLARL